MGSRMMGADLPSFIAQDDVQVVGVADCFADRRLEGKRFVDTYYRNSDCIATRFQEEILQREDIDAVVIATGDRWHGVLSAEAARSGKDIYCEKPFSLTVREGRRMVEVMNRTGTIWQCGTQRRSVMSYQFVVEMVRQGRIGRLQSMTGYLGGGPWRANLIPMPQGQPPPSAKIFDYDRWLGQSPFEPYSETKIARWRRRWDTSGGMITDMAPHYTDIMQWANRTELGSPVYYEGKADWPDPRGYDQMPVSFKVRAEYADGVVLNLTDGPKGIRFAGDAGWIHIADEGEIRAEPQSILAERRDFTSTSYREMGGHTRNFLDAIRSRMPPASYPELAHRGHSIAHCANICLRLGRRLQWDAKSESFIGDEEANRLLDRSMRAPWRI